VQRSNAGSCAELHAAIQKAIREFTAGAEQADDLTLVVVEYRGVA
jgi:serine phosphatase RsbU (regulator of sigma subunit)